MWQNYKLAFVCLGGTQKGKLFCCISPQIPSHSLPVKAWELNLNIYGISPVFQEINEVLIIKSTYKYKKIKIILKIASRVRSGKLGSPAGSQGEAWAGREVREREQQREVPALTAIWRGFFLPPAQEQLTSTRQDSTGWQDWQSKLTVYPMTPSQAFSHQYGLLGLALVI